MNYTFTNNIFRKVFIFTFMIIAFLVPNMSSAQTSLHGKVKEADSGFSLIGVNVFLLQDNVVKYEMITDIGGRFVIESIVAGEYVLNTEYVGYVSEKRNISIVEGKKNEVEVFMNEGALLDEIIVTGMPAEYTPSSKPSKSASMMMSTAPMTADAGYRASSYDTYVPIGDKSSLPSSGQVTAGEWNDLHNWKDWVELLENEDYNIMTERFQIFPKDRYHVLVTNNENAVMANIPVSLRDDTGKVLWESITDNAGIAELWGSAFIEKNNPAHIVVDGQRIDDLVSIENGSNVVKIDRSCYTNTLVDIVFTVDATSSMADEISYLKAELLDVIQRIESEDESIDLRVGSVFYRDTKDDYLTRETPISHDIEKTLSFIEVQNARGGGDKPEAVDEALQKTLELNWREEALKITFLLLDAPPHDDEATLTRIRAQIKEAAARGIKLIPITASGIDRETEFLMKFMAMMTNGTYVFITDDSGIGNAHLAPVVDDYEVELLNDCLVRLITQYSKSYSCEENEEKNTEIQVYPNPSTQYINVKAESIPQKIKVLSASGMVVKTITPSDKITRVELDDLVNGIYTISIIFEDDVVSKQIILLK